MDKTIATNIKLKTILTEWDPFQLGSDCYDTESADAVQAVHQYDDMLSLAKALKTIYEFSFEKTLPIAECKKVAAKLLLVKNEASCEL
ncbi:MAG TPA: DUF1871 family protein [Chondromyces sp.]|nr:DUF1871 family protein [Chondromyces sp.]